MRNLKQLLVLGLLAISLCGQGYANLVYGQYLHHSENDEPTSWTRPIADVWSGDVGYEFNLKGSSLIQVGLGFDENYNPKYGKYEFDPDLGERVQYNLEQSIPLYVRMFWSDRGMTGYGVGPIYSPVKQTFVLDYSRLSYIERLFIRMPWESAGLLDYPDSYPASFMAFYLWKFVIKRVFGFGEVGRI